MDTHPKTALLEEMERLSGIYITVRAELDQTEMTFAELLDLDVGSLIQLARPTGENIDVYAEEVLIGWAEVLLMDGTLTVRLADLRNARLPGFPEEQVESQAGSSQEE